MKCTRKISGMLLGVMFYYSFSSSQAIKHIFFDYLQDSIKSRTLLVNAPVSIQSFSVGNTFITDYVGSTRICVFTGVVTGDKDTFLAMHSLFNGTGNLSIDAEIPLGLVVFRKNKSMDFIGLSFQPRISTLINMTNTFEKSSVSYDFGMNITTKLSGDLNNITMKFILRNAICFGNNQFVTRAFQLTRNDFYYSAAILKIRAGVNIFSLNYPILLWTYQHKPKQDLPLFVGYTMKF